MDSLGRIEIAPIQFRSFLLNRANSFAQSLIDGAFHIPAANSYSTQTKKPSSATQMYIYRKTIFRCTRACIYASIYASI